MSSDSNRDQPTDRRGFFRRLLAGGIDSAQKAGEAAISSLGPIGQSLQGNEAPQAPEPVAPAEKPVLPPGSQLPPEDRYLRPPGAVPEDVLAETCSACRKCVVNCPAQAIQLDGHTAEGLPYIQARIAPCVICEDLSCMKGCPSGALELVDAGADIDMGEAVVDPLRCLRAPKDGRKIGEDCQLCVQQCPIGETAIRVGRDGKIAVLAGCTGCGVCEAVCPTEPPSVWVEPHLSHSGQRVSR